MPFRVCMISDFFYPNIGGVESHVYYLSQFLIQRGNHVIVITQSYGNRRGIRYLFNNLKVYYLPRINMIKGTSSPTFFLNGPVMRQIFKREQINVVHCHQGFSNLGLESLMHLKNSDIKVVFTDHSLIFENEISTIAPNMLFKFLLIGIDNMICVSNKCKENTVYRSGIDPSKVYVIPNAVVASNFKNKGTRIDTPTIVVASRLVERKGINLLLDIVPDVCSRTNARFVIAGDGPLRAKLEQMREKYELQDRVEMLGSVSHDAMIDVLSKGHVFLNTSLTEAFCIAIIEAACAGLKVVSTSVGGVPEVLPRKMITLCNIDASEITEALIKEIQHTKIRKNNYKRLANLYNWEMVAERTEMVYAQPHVRIGFEEQIKLFLVHKNVPAVLFAMMYAINKVVRYFF